LFGVLDYGSFFDVDKDMWIATAAVFFLTWGASTCLAASYDAWLNLWLDNATERQIQTMQVNHKLLSLFKVFLWSKNMGNTEVWTYALAASLVGGLIASIHQGFVNDEGAVVCRKHNGTFDFPGGFPDNCKVVDKYGGFFDSSRALPRHFLPSSW